MELTTLWFTLIAVLFTGYFILEGFDKDWSPVTKQSVANYSNVPPGDYMFKVQATANLKDWSEPVLFGFALKPPVWMTPAFYALYALAAAGLSSALNLGMPSNNCNYDYNVGALSCASSSSNVGYRLREGLFGKSVTSVAIAPDHRSLECQTALVPLIFSRS